MRKNGSTQARSTASTAERSRTAPTTRDAVAQMAASASGGAIPHQNICSRS